MTVEVRADSGRIWRLGPEIREAGTIVLHLSTLGAAGEGALTITVSATSSNGATESRLRLLADAE